MTQESNNWGKETLFVPFAPIYNDFTNSILVPIQNLIKSTQSATSLWALNTNPMLGLPVVCSVVLRRTVVGVDWRFGNLSGSHHQSLFSGCLNVRQHQQQSFSGLHYKPGRSLKPQHWLTWVQTFHCYKNKIRTFWAWNCQENLRTQSLNKLYCFLLKKCVCPGWFSVCN